MKYLSFLNTRYLTTRFIPLAAVLVVAGGVFCLIPVLSVMEGFKTQMRASIRGSLSHLTVNGRGYVSMVGEFEVQDALESLVLHHEIAERAAEIHGIDEACRMAGMTDADLEAIRQLAQIWVLDADPDAPPPPGTARRESAEERLAASVLEGKLMRIVLNIQDLTAEESLTTFDLPTDDADRYQPVVACAPFVEAMAIFKSSVLATCSIRGIEPAEEAKVGEFLRYLLKDDEIEQMLLHPRMRLPKDRETFTTEEAVALFSRERRDAVRKIYASSEDDPGSSQIEKPQPIVVGIEALRTGRFQLGRTVQLTTYSPVDQSVRFGNFRVVGAFQSNAYELDLGLVYMPLGAMGDFLDLWDEREGDNRFSGFSVRLADYDQAEAVRDQINRYGLGEFDRDKMMARTWEEERATLLQAVDTEKRIISAMMLLIVGFAGVVIFLILTVMVIEKTRDLGVLRSLGATRRGVIMLFLRTGMILCITGTTLGAVAGWVFTDNINTVHDWIERLTGRSLFPPTIYYLTEIPVDHNWGDWALVLLPSILFGFLASLIPAMWAANRDPVKALRHE